MILDLLRCQETFGYVFEAYCTFFVNYLYFWWILVSLTVDWFWSLQNEWPCWDFDSILTVSNIIFQFFQHSLVETNFIFILINHFKDNNNLVTMATLENLFLNQLRLFSYKCKIGSHFKHEWLIYFNILSRKKMSWNTFCFVTFNLSIDLSYLSNLKQRK